jgi:hypothetical protein
MAVPAQQPRTAPAASQEGGPARPNAGNDKSWLAPPTDVIFSKVLSNTDVIFSKVLYKLLTITQDQITVWHTSFFLFLGSFKSKVLSKFYTITQD